MLLRVEQRHINSGKPGHPQHCPVTLAVKGAFNEQNVSCNVETIMVWDKYLATTPPKAAKFIRDFDARRPVKPFEFELVFTDMQGQSVKEGNIC